MKKLVLLLILSVFLLTACGSEQDAITEDTEDTAIKDTVSFEQEKQYIDTGRFISPEDFNHSIKTYQQQIEIDFVPRIAVAPHHTVAAELTAQCFSYLPQDTETVIILAPNHLNNGKQIMTTDASFTSLAGTVDADTEAISALVKDGALSYAEDQFSTEHSVGMMIPYIAHFMPEAKIIPIICHHSLDMQDGQKLLNALEPYIDEKTVIIGSIDFSHGLDKSGAEERNKQMLIYINDCVPSTVERLNSTYLDSPGILATLMAYAVSLDRKNPTVLADSNAAVIMQTDQQDVTSYLTLLY